VATYHFDSETGDDGNDGSSPAKARRTLRKANETVFQPGDRLLFRSGSRWTGQLKPQGSGDAANGKPIVADRYGDGPLPRIDGEGEVEATLVMENVEGWEVNRLEITNRGPSPRPRRKGVFLHLRDFGTAGGVVLRELFVHDVNGTCVKEEGGGAGILWFVEGTAIPSRYDGLLIEGCRLERCDRDGIMGWGYWQRCEWFPSLRVVIRGNRLEDIGGDGIMPSCCDGVLVERNVLHGAGRRVTDGENIAGIWPWSCDNALIQFNEASGARGPWDAQGFDSDWNSRNTIIQCNYSHDNEGGFLLICDDGAQRKVDSVGNVGTVVRYNLSVNDGFRTTGTHAGFAPAIHLTGPIEGALVHNNTIVAGKTPEGGDPRILRCTSWGGFPRDARFVNNIFVAEDERSVELGEAARIEFENNLYWKRILCDDSRAIRDDPRFAGTLEDAVRGDGRNAFRLKEGSPALSAGLLIPGHGGIDLSCERIPEGRPPSLGALERPFRG
jgi:hypothetical protein